MTDEIALPEPATGDNILNLAIFTAGGAVVVGATLVGCNVISELLQRKDKTEEMER